jgi:hypothetical protein
LSCSSKFTLCELCCILKNIALSWKTSDHQMLKRNTRNIWKESYQHIIFAKKFILFLSKKFKFVVVLYVILFLPTAQLIIIASNCSLCTTFVCGNDFQIRYFGNARETSPYFQFFFFLMLNLFLVVPKVNQNIQQFWKMSQKSSGTYLW